MAYLQQEDEEESIDLGPMSAGFLYTAPLISMMGAIGAAATLWNRVRRNRQSAGEEPSDSTAQQKDVVYDFERACMRLLLYELPSRNITVRSSVDRRNREADDSSQLRPQGTIYIKHEDLETWHFFFLTARVSHIQAAATKTTAPALLAMLLNGSEDFSPKTKYTLVVDDKDMYDALTARCLPYIRANLSVMLVTDNGSDILGEKYVAHYGVGEDRRELLLADKAD